MTSQLERFDPSNDSGRISYEHFHRYAICRESVAGKRVLDLACGTGFGTAILAVPGADVTGIDISAAAVKEARKRFGKNGIKFRVADCYDLPFEAGSFDVVVANEMLEHVEDHDGLIEEVRRVLVEGGQFLVSTPNKQVYNRYKPLNTFHVSELEVPQFRKLLKRHFKHVRITGTRMALMSVGYNFEQAKSKDNLAVAKLYRGSFTGTLQPVIEDDDLWLEDAEYVLAACSDEPIEPHPSPSTVYYSRDNDLWLEHEKIMAWASQLHTEDEVLRADLAKTRSDAEAATVSLATAEAKAGSLAERVEDLRGLAAAVGSAMDLQRDALLRESGQNLASTAGLLGRMTGSMVPVEPAAVVQALFGLNETIVIQRIRLQELSTAKERLATVEQQLESERAALAELRMAKFSADTQLESSQRAQLQLIAELEELRRLREQTTLELERQKRAEEIHQNELAVNRSEKAVALAELAEKVRIEKALEEELRTEREAHTASGNDLEAVRRQSGQLQAELGQKTGELAEVRKELNDVRARLAETAERLAQAIADLSDGRQDHAQKISSPAATIRSAAKTQPVSVVEPANAKSPTQAAQHFFSSHRKIRASVLGASMSIRGRVPPAPEPVHKEWWQRIAKKKSRQFKTAIFAPTFIESQDETLADYSLEAFLADPACREISPHPLFAAKNYLENNPDVAAEGILPLLHYVMHGWREGRSPHPYFANDWYLEQNPDVLAFGIINPLDHYLEFGWREGRWPNPAFDPQAYLDRYRDVAAADIEPLSHYVTFGEAEGRELPIRDMTPDMIRQMPSKAAAMPLLAYLLTAEPEPVREVPAAAATAKSVLHPRATIALSTAWPPAPLNAFWPPLTLRNFVTDRYGEEVYGLYWYLYSVMAAYQDLPAEFADSQVCQDLVARAAELARRPQAAKNAAPHATIIIPVFNNILDTMLCIVSLLEMGSEHEFEVIIADDGSTDATARIVNAIGGNVRHFRQPKNLGFLGNCNAAADQAAGKTIVLLNNDTIVMPRWLDGLLAPFESLERIGLVGSKLINWDGSLQEAGGIFWKDGSAWNFGRGQDARAPEFDYLKDVDYISGASIAVPADLWRKLGGFDPAFSPAYCEDSDLAFRLREAGYRTIYNPSSEVIHHEGRSHGRDLSSGIKAYQVTNQQHFFERWREVLERDHFPNAQNVLRARDRSSSRKHVLFIDHYVPQWDQDAGSRTIYQYMKLMIDIGCSVSFWPDNLWRDPKYVPALQALGIEVIFGPKFVGKFDQFVKDRSDLYDVVFISRPHVAENYISSIRENSKARIFYYGMDLHFKRMQAGAALGEPISDEQIGQMRELELKVCSGSDVIFFPDPEEVAIIKDLVGGEREFVANPVFVYSDKEIAQSRSQLKRLNRPTSGNLLFVGGFNHTPNREGIIWFANHVFPSILAEHTDANLRIVGSNPPLDVLELETDRISVLGFVSDEELEQCYADADVVVAPLRYGAGVKGKVIEAMAKGVPVATTAFGAQGIDDPSSLLFQGDTATELADAVLEALRNRTAARKRCKKALNFIDTRYSYSALQNVFMRLLAN